MINSEVEEGRKIVCVFQVFESLGEDVDGYEESAENAINVLVI